MKPLEIKEGYTGIGLSSDAMDCCIPLRIDSRNFCAHFCRYCFTDNLRTKPTGRKQLSINELERFLSGKAENRYHKALYPLLQTDCPVQLGGLSDPFDAMELQTGWAKEAIPKFVEHDVPVRISTKGGDVLQKPEYLRLFEANPELFWVAFSIVTPDDDLLLEIDRGAPKASSRLAAMKELSKIGVKTSLRFRPFLPGVSDRKWEELLERAKEASAQAVSFEFIFIKRGLTARKKLDYKDMYKMMGYPNFGEEWKESSHRSETLARGSKYDKYRMIMDIRQKAHELGMTFAISDPHFKELGDTMCCCGFPDTGDKYFSRFSRANMTSILVEAKRLHDAGTPRTYTFRDVFPEWLKNFKIGDCVNLSSWDKHELNKYVTVWDSFRDKWNDPENPRGPYIYFRGVLVPLEGLDDEGDKKYIYRPWTTYK